MNILHKLGLCKLSEVNDLIAKAEAVCADADAIAEKAKDTEECYKAMLAMYNEAQTVEHAVKVISEYCANTTCTECDFNKRVCKYADTCKHFSHGKCHSDIPCEHWKTPNCELANIPPCDWGVSND